MKNREIIILSNDFIFSNVAARFLQHKIFGFHHVKAVTFQEFFHEKIMKENNPVLIIHAESIQRMEEIEMLSTFSYQVFSIIILADSCMKYAEKKFYFLPSKKLRNLALNENSFTIIKNIKSLVDEIRDNEMQSVKEIAKYLSVLRVLQFKQQFDDRHLKLFNLLSLNFINEKMAERMFVSPRQYDRLQAETAIIAGVENTKQALIRYAMDNGLLTPEPDDDFIPDII